MRWILALLVVLVIGQSARVGAQDGPPDVTEGAGPSKYFPGNNPDGQKTGPTNQDMPDSADPGWLDWLYKWIHWMWAMFMVAWHYCIEVPADWFRGLAKAWFCWVGVGLLEFIGHVLNLDDWHESMTIGTIRQGLNYFREQAGFIGRVFPFTLWAGLAGLYLSIESALAAVKWIIGIIPGT